MKYTSKPIITWFGNSSLSKYYSLETSDFAEVDGDVGTEVH